MDIGKIKFIIGVIVFTFLVYLYFINNFSLKAQIFKEEYYAILHLMLVFMTTYCIAIAKNPHNILQPLHIYTAFHLCIFFITPLALVNAGEAYCWGTNVMVNSIYATILVIIGYICFVIGYTKKKIVAHERKLRLSFSPRLTKKILKYSYLSFGLLVVINLGILIFSGYGISFLLSLGNGSSKVTGIPANLLFLINISYLMLVPWLFICAFSKNIYIKFTASYILFVIFFAYGWRFIIYIIALSACVIYYRTSNKKPNLRELSFVVLGLLLISTFMGNTRGSIRSGESLDFKGFDSENIVYTLESNFDIYKTYYGVVAKYPCKYDYWYGEAIFVSPIVMWIPRFIWPEKPTGGEYPLTLSMKRAIGSDVINKAAMSSPNLTEYYLDFGPLGIMFFSLLIGFISKHLFQMYFSNSIYEIIKYALFLGFLIQLINRGYVSQLVTLFIFLYIPLFIYKKFNLKARHKYGSSK